MKRHDIFFIAVSLWLAMLLGGCSRSDPPGRAAPVVSSIPAAVTAAEMATKTPLAVSSTPLPAPTTTPLRACAPTDPETTDAIIIGAILPLSRPGAYRAGFAMQAALNMALQHINDNGGVQGRPIRVITYDSAGVPRQGALFAERLITLDCASAIVGLYHNNVASAVSDVANRFGIPLMLVGPRAEELTADQRRSVFRIAPTHTMKDQQLAAWLTDVASAFPERLLADGSLTVVIVAENRQQERDEVEHITLWLRKAGFAVKPYFVDLPTQDYSPVIARIVTLDMFPDVVVNRLNNGPSLDFHQQLLQAGVSPKNGTIVVTGEDALDDRSFWAAIPNGEQSVVLMDGPWSGAITEMGHEFVREYDEQLGRWPEMYAFAAYDALHLVADALNRATTLAFPDAIETLESSDITLAAGRYHFPYGQAHPPADERTPGYLWHQWPEPPLLFLQYDEPNQSSSDMPVVWPPAYRTVDAPYIP